jgi:hypothetical protein
MDSQMRSTFFENFENFEKSLAGWYAIATLVTGIITMIVLAFPVVVQIGFWLLIVPGIILSLTPMAFLWLMSFGAVWFVGRNFVPSLYALIASLLVGVGILWGVPLVQQKVVLSQLSRAEKPSVFPKERIVLSGNIKLVFDNNRFEYDEEVSVPSVSPSRGLGCDTDCLKLLFMDSVTSVTIAPVSVMAQTSLRGRDGSASAQNEASTRVYRLGRKPECTRAGAITQLQGVTHSPMIARWQMRLAAGACILGSLPAREAIDFQVVGNETKFDLEPSPLRVPPTKEAALGRVTNLEITNGDGLVLLRHQVARAGSTRAPLMAGTTGNVLRGPIYFVWLDKTIDKQGNQVNTQPNIRRPDLFAQYTNLQTETATRQDAPSPPDPEVAAVLKAALNDSTRDASDAAFEMSGVYFQQFNQQVPTEADLVFMRDLVLDKRVTELGGLDYVLKTMGSTNVRFIEPLLTRLMASQLTDNSTTVQTLNTLLNKMAPGAFAVETPQIATILADGDKRSLAYKVLMRQSDRGTAAVPILLDSLLSHAQLANRIDSNEGTRKTYSENIRTFEAAREGLCRLGPAASGALPQLAAWTQSGALQPRQTDSMQWHIMLVRLGVPIATLQKPSSNGGSEKDYQGLLLSRVNYRALGNRICED